MGGVSLFIVGAGPMGREALDIYRVLGRDREVSGFVVEDAYLKERSVAGHTVHAWSKLAARARGSRFIAAIGSPKRAGIVAAIEQAGGAFDTLVHPSVTLAPTIKLGEGCIVMAGVRFTIDADVGAHTIINLGCTISHDVRIGRLVTISPGCHIAGCSTIEDEAFLGTGVNVIDRVRIGKGAVIGAGGAVVGDIPPGVTAVGVPARPVAK